MFFFSLWKPIAVELKLNCLQLANFIFLFCASLSWLFFIYTEKNGKAKLTNGGDIRMKTSFLRSLSAFFFNDFER